MSAGRGCSGPRGLPISWAAAPSRGPADERPGAAVREAGPRESGGDVQGASSAPGSPPDSPLCRGFAPTFHHRRTPVADPPEKSGVIVQRRAVALGADLTIARKRAGSTSATSRPPLTASRSTGPASGSPRRRSRTAPPSAPPGGNHDPNQVGGTAARRHRRRRVPKCSHGTGVTGRGLCTGVRGVEAWQGCPKGDSLRTPTSRGAGAQGSRAFAG
jgi:hypothetical protein